MTILVVLASAGLAALIATMITLTIVYRADTDLYDHIEALETDLHGSKERINEDLVEQTQRLNRHRDKLANDYKRLESLEDRHLRMAQRVSALELKHQKEHSS